MKFSLIPYGFHLTSSHTNPIHFSNDEIAQSFHLNFELTHFTFVHPSISRKTDKRNDKYFNSIMQASSPPQFNKSLQSNLDVNYIFTNGIRMPIKKPLSLMPKLNYLHSKTLYTWNYTGALEENKILHAKEIVQ